MTILRRLLLLIALFAVTSASTAGCADQGSEKYDKYLSLPQRKVVADYGQDWEFTLNGGGWIGSKVTVQLTIKNREAQRITFGVSLASVSAKLMAIDYTGKLFSPDGWVGFEEMWYEGEYYPGESRSGTVTFSMSPYSGQTWLYMTRFTTNWPRYPIFDLGLPAPS